MRRIRRDDSGATVVEAAFVIPIIFLFIFALIDIGLWVFETSQASSAARDGARAGIVLNLPGATTTAAKQANADTIRAAVMARLTEKRITNPANDITITCRDLDGSAHNGDGSCTLPAAGNPSSIRLEVEVKWKRSFLTFIGGIFGGPDRTITGKATMVVVGKPAAG